MAAHPLTIFFRTFLQKPAPLAGARALAPLGATATQSPSGDWARGTPGIPHQGPDPGQARRKAHLTPTEDRVEGGGEQGPEAPEASWQRRGKQERGTWCLLLIRKTDKPRPGYASSGGRCHKDIQGGDAGEAGAQPGSHLPPRQHSKPSRPPLPHTGVRKALYANCTEDLFPRTSQDLLSWPLGPRTCCPQLRHVGPHPQPLPNSCSAQLSPLWDTWSWRLYINIESFRGWTVSRG